MKWQETGAEELKAGTAVQSRERAPCRHEGQVQTLMGWDRDDPTSIPGSSLWLLGGTGRWPPAHSLCSPWAASCRAGGTRPSPLMFLFAVWESVAAHTQSGRVASTGCQSSF